MSQDVLRFRVSGRLRGPTVPVNFYSETLVGEIERVEILLDAVPECPGFPEPDRMRDWFW